MSQNFYVQAANTTFTEAVQAVMDRACLIEYGIIEEVVSPGVVRVAVAAAKDASDVRVYTCVLVCPGNSSFMHNVMPNVNDRVVVFFPRRFVPEMFNLENTDVIINGGATGYSPFTALAMGLNQFRSADYHNYVVEENGMLTINLAYSEDDEKNLLVIKTGEKGEITFDNNEVITFATTADGDITLTSNDATFSIDKDMNIEVTNGKAVVTLAAEGDVTVDTGKCTITADSQGIITLDANGKTQATLDGSQGIMEFKAGQATISSDASGAVTVAASSTVSITGSAGAGSLYQALDALLKLLNSGAIMTAGSPSSQAMLPQQFAAIPPLLQAVLK